MVKAGMSVAQEVFAQMIADHCGRALLAVPRIKLVRFDEEEWGVIKEQLLMRSRGVSAREKVQKQLNRPFFMGEQRNQS